VTRWFEWAQPTRLKKFSRDHPSAFAGHRDALLARTLDDRTDEVRWHLMAIAARLSPDAEEAKVLTAYLDHCLRQDSSKIR
jgi:hypothetical protein